MKVCSKCGEAKTLEEFFRRASASDGRMSCCKKCKTKALIVWRAKNQKRWNEYVKKNRTKRKQECRAGKRDAPSGTKKTNRYIVDGDVSYIYLRGGIVTVDTQDISLVLDGKGKWGIKKNPRTSYAQRSRDFGTEKMHRHILGLNKGDGVEVDHEDHDGLNNRRCNLRCTDVAGNSRNKPMQTNNSSGVNGITWHKGRQRWRACISIKGVQKHLIETANIDIAIKARNEAEIEHEFHKNHGLNV